ncbi:MAG: helix-turn-helix transcriptional regulator [Elusimicrobia bacterium]|nr:helix-turn-helix transcriptional regulator [Elusimicrobiota bacterium]
MTLRQLGQLVHIDPTTLAHWERDERLSKKELFQRLDRYFKLLEPYYLL